MTRAYVGLGANLGERRGALERALELLRADALIDVVAVSAFRETEPVGYVDQPRFLNAAAALETEFRPRELLERLLAVERELGRTRDGPRFGPRTIDLDLLVYGDVRLKEPGLERAPPAPARAALRARAAGRARARPRRARPRPGFGPPREARLTACRTSTSWTNTRPSSSSRSRRSTRPSSALFRYCVLTQDATYLCNTLDLEYTPQPSYPFFQLRMEDVWVWDKNRPTRIIPRARVYTSGDVTVEELRGEGDEPKLTAEALAEKIGEALPRDEDV